MRRRGAARRSGAASLQGGIAIVAASRTGRSRNNCQVHSANHRQFVVDRLDPVGLAREVERALPLGRRRHLATQGDHSIAVVDVDVALGSQVKLVPPFGGKLEAEVNGSWIDDIDGNRRIGVKLLDANGWFAE